MPVRQSWVECVLASGGYGSSSFQWHLIILTAPWATGASRSRSRSCSSVQHAAVSYASQCISGLVHTSHTVAREGLVARVASRDFSRGYTRGTICATHVRCGFLSSLCNSTFIGTALVCITRIKPSVESLKSEAHHTEAIRHRFTAWNRMDSGS